MSDDLTTLSICAAVGLWIAWQIHVFRSGRRNDRERREQIDRLAMAFGLKAVVQDSVAHQNLKRLYGDAVGENWGRDGLYHPSAVTGTMGGWGISSLCDGNGLSVFQAARATRRGSRDDVVLGVRTTGALPPFRRQPLGSLQIGVTAARRRDAILDLPDGSFIMLRESTDRERIARVFSPPVMSFLATHKRCRIAGNGDQLWIAVSDSSDDIEAVLADAAVVLREAS